MRNLLEQTVMQRLASEQQSHPHTAAHSPVAKRSEYGQTAGPGGFTSALSSYHNSAQAVRMPAIGNRQSVNSVMNPAASAQQIGPYQVDPTFKMLKAK